MFRPVLAIFITKNKNKNRNLIKTTQKQIQKNKARV